MPNTLNPDQSAVVEEKIKNAMQALSALSMFLQSETLDKKSAKNALQLIEYSVAEISRQTGIETNTAQDINRRFSEARRLNGRIRELEQSVGEAVSIHFIGEAVKLLDKKLQYWWRTKGFGFTNSFSIAPYGGAMIDFGFTLNHRHRFTQTPISDAEREILSILKMVNDGYQLATENMLITDSSQVVTKMREIEMLDNDVNRQLLTQFIKKQFPSARLTSIKHRFSAIGFVIDGISLVIDDLKEIDQLPTDSNFTNAQLTSLK